jgi:hypothetical protein
MNDLREFYRIGSNPWKEVKTVEYHSKDWELLVETGWITLYVTYGEKQIAYMGYAI